MNCCGVRSLHLNDHIVSKAKTPQQQGGVAYTHPDDWDAEDAKGAVIDLLTLDGEVIDERLIQVHRN